MEEPFPPSDPLAMESSLRETYAQKKWMSLWIINEKNLQATDQAKF
jgi:hypothetical protein